MSNFEDQFRTRSSEITVIVPIFNGRRTITRCLSSIADQVGVSPQVVVIEDGSPDPSEDLVMRFADCFESLRYIALETPSGSPAKPRNIGLALATTEYVAFLDADDFWLPAHLEVSARNLKVHRSVLVCSNAYQVPGNKSSVTVVSRLVRRSDFGELLKHNFVVTSSVLAQRKTLIDVGGFPERKPVYEDYCVWLKVASSESITFLNSLNVVYDNSDNQSMSDMHRSRGISSFWTIVEAGRLMQHSRRLFVMYFDRVVILLIRAFLSDVPSYSRRFVRSS